MKSARNVLFSLTVGFAVLAPPWTYLDSRHIGAAYAQPVGVTGTLDFVGTLDPQAGSARARVRVDQGDCDTGQVNNLYIIISSGNLNNTSGSEANSVNMKNAYSTLLTALLSGKRVQIFGPQSCSPNAAGEIFLDLPTGNVNVIK
jgi:hypothetical protein